MPTIQPAPSNRLYRLQDLMSEFDPGDPGSILETHSFEQYRAYCPQRTVNLRDLNEIKNLSVHDASISDALFTYLYGMMGQPESIRPVGFMGSSSLERGKSDYADFARLARDVAQAGFLVVTGGGPAMMEAASLGAYFSNAPQAIFDAALQQIQASTVQKLPRGVELVSPDGSLKPVDPAIIEQFHRWYADALAVANTWTTPAPSLAVSTWEYGQEPVMPFATDYAAYFQNSIREAALVRESKVGVIYGRGGGGTLREAFQDVEENYAASTTDAFTPMVFFNRNNYWSPTPTSANPIGMPVFQFVEDAFKNAFETRPAVQWQNKVLLTTDVPTILTALNDQKTASAPLTAAFFSDQVAAQPNTFV